MGPAIFVGGDRPYVEGSREVACSVCGRAAYASPSAFDMLDGASPPPVVFAEDALAMIDRARAAGREVRSEIAPGAIAELLETMRKERGR
jgi:hypothetical protein